MVIHYTGLGSLHGAAIDSGEYQLSIFGCMYFSTVTYTTVGFGDIIPHAGLRMLAGAEALTGFLLIGWTISFTYLVMEKYWNFRKD